MSLCPGLLCLTLSLALLIQCLSRNNFFSILYTQQDVLVYPRLKTTVPDDSQEKVHLMMAVYASKHALLSKGDTVCCKRMVESISKGDTACCKRMVESISKGDTVCCKRMVESISKGDTVCCKRMVESIWFTSQCT
jgi:hypothetical protein